MQLDDDALTWRVNQVDETYDNSDGLLKDLTSLVTQTTTMISISTATPFSALATDVPSSVDSTTDGLIVNWVYSNCGCLRSQNIHCSGLLNPSKYCHALCKNWLKHYMATWTH